jgi:hypothetical protein
VPRRADLNISRRVQVRRSGVIWGLILGGCNGMTLRGCMRLRRTRDSDRVIDSVSGENRQSTSSSHIVDLILGYLILEGRTQNSFQGDDSEKMAELDFPHYLRRRSISSGARIRTRAGTRATMSPLQVPGTLSVSVAQKPKDVRAFALQSNSKIHAMPFLPSFLPSFPSFGHHATSHFAFAICFS